MSLLKTQLQHLGTYTLCVLTVLMVVSCGSTQVKDSAESSAPEVINLLSTKGALPIREYDKEGAVIPFVPAPNPYLALKGKIDKDIIMDFISARRAFKAEQFDEATRLLNIIVNKDKKLSGPWVMLGDISALKGDNEKAVEHYQKAIAVNAKNVNAYIPLAKLLRLQGEFIPAQNVYAKALRVWKHFPEAHLNLGILYDVYLNDPLQAQQHMEAYQFLTEEKDKKVAQWLAEIQSRTGIAPNLYIGPSNTSQIDQTVDDKGES